MSQEKSFKFNLNPSEEGINFREWTLMLMLAVVVYITWLFSRGVSELLAQNGGVWPALSSEWAGLVLKLILGLIVISVLVQIVLAILHTAATQEEPDNIEDERVKLIELRGSHLAHIVSGIGFLLMLFALWRGTPAMPALNLLVYAFFLSGAVDYAAQLIYHRRGF